MNRQRRNVRVYDHRLCETCGSFWSAAYEFGACAEPCCGAPRLDPYWVHRATYDGDRLIDQRDSIRPDPGLRTSTPTSRSSAFTSSAADRWRWGPA